MLRILNMRMLLNMLKYVNVDLGKKEALRHLDSSSTY